MKNKRLLLLMLIVCLLIPTVTLAKESVLSKTKDTTINFETGKYKEKLSEFRENVYSFLIDNNKNIMTVGIVIIFILAIIGIFIKVFRSYAFLFTIITVVIYMIIKAGIPALRMLY